MSGRTLAKRRKRKLEPGSKSLSSSSSSSSSMASLSSAAKVTPKSKKAAVKAKSSSSSSKSHKSKQSPVPLKRLKTGKIQDRHVSGSGSGSGGGSGSASASAEAGTGVAKQKKAGSNQPVQEAKEGTHSKSLLDMSYRELISSAHTESDDEEEAGDGNQMYGPMAAVSDLHKTNRYFSQPNMQLDGAAAFSNPSKSALKKQTQQLRNPKTLRAIFKEVKSLMTSPQDKKKSASSKKNAGGDSIGGLMLTPDVSFFLHYDEDQPNFMRAVVTGVRDSPYAFGAFLFDIFIPSGYPAKAPKCVHITPGTDRVYGNHTPGGISPNIYAMGGKVCLSLLGTWGAAGVSGAGWDPKQSSIYQLLSSVGIQILGAEEPYYMEPGLGGWEGTMPKTPSKEAVMYKEEVQRGTLQYGIIGALENLVSEPKRERRAFQATSSGCSSGGSSAAASSLPFPDLFAVSGSASSVYNAAMGAYSVVGGGAKGKAKQSNPWKGSFREVLRRHFFFHRCNIIEHLVGWFTKTTCKFHQQALRFLILRCLSLMATLVSEMLGSDARTTYLNAQIALVEAVVFELKGSATSLRNPLNLNAVEPWRNKNVEVLFHRLAGRYPNYKGVEVASKAPGKETKTRYLAIDGHLFDVYGGSGSSSGSGALPLAAELDGFTCDLTGDSPDDAVFKKSPKDDDFVIDLCD